MIPIRKRLDQGGIDKAEDGYCGSDSQGQDDYCRCREAGIFSKLADSVSKILRQSLDLHGSTSFPCAQARDVTQVMTTVPGVETECPIQTNLPEFRMLERTRIGGVAKRMEKRGPTRMQTFEQS